MYCGLRSHGTAGTSEGTLVIVILFLFYVLNRCCSTSLEFTRLSELCRQQFLLEKQKKAAH